MDDSYQAQGAQEHEGYLHKATPAKETEDFDLLSWPTPKERQLQPDFLEKSCHTDEIF